MERGFVPIIVVIVALAFLGVGSSLVIFSKLKEQKTDMVNIIQPEETYGRSEVREVLKDSAAKPSVIEAPETKRETKEKKPGAKNIIPSRKDEAQSVQTTKFAMPTASAPAPKSAKMVGLEREITVLFQSGNVIGLEHYARLSDGLNTEVTAGADMGIIGKLRKMLDALNPDKVASISSSSPSSSTPTCEDNIKPQLVRDITDFPKIQKITAPGSSSSEGPKGHSFVWTNHEKVPVYAPIMMTLDSGTYVKDNAESPAQYLLFFIVKNNCNYQVKFDHIDEPIPAIKELLPTTPAVADSRTQNVSKKIEFQAGDLIGHTAGNLQSGNWDFGLYNMKEKGVLGTQYSSYGVHGYAVCWVDFYAPEKQTQYRQLLDGPKLLCSF